MLPTEQLSPPARSAELDASRDLEGVDAIGVPLVFGDEGALVSGRDPLGSDEKPRS